MAGAQVTLRRGLAALRLRRPPAGPVVTLYSRANCHLCDQAERLARRAFGRRGVVIVDITSSAELEDRYVFRVPVLALGDRVLAEGQIGPAEIAEARRAVHRAARIWDPT